MVENDNQHQQLFLFKGQTVVTSLDGNGRKRIFNILFFLPIVVFLIETIELSNIANGNDNNSDSGISQNDSEAEVLIYDR
jgi:hypothetical protein